MDESQNTLNEMIAMEGMDIKEDKERLDNPSVRLSLLPVSLSQNDLNICRNQFAEFWVHLGKDRRALSINAEHGSLLSTMSTYRAQARDRVKSAMDQLVQLSEDLAELRDRVVEPALIGADAAIPIEVHLEGLRRGVQRLKGFRKEGEERWVRRNDV